MTTVQVSSATLDRLAQKKLDLRKQGLPVKDLEDVIVWMLEQLDG